MNRDFHWQSYEQSPFKLRPLLKMNQGYKIIYPLLIDEILKNWLYDFCKRNAGKQFSDHFGNVFENFIKKSISNYSIPHFEEKWLKNNTKLEKFVDFIIPCKRGNILIEAKACEASPNVRENPTDETLSKTLKSSVVKAIHQASYVNDNILDGLLDLNTNNFILVVTYKDLFLGSAEDVWDEFLKKRLTEKDFKTNLKNLVPEKIFFLSVDDLNRFLYCFNGNQDAMFQKLEDILILKRDINKKRFIFSMYLDEELKGLEYPHFLDDNFNEISNSLMKSLKK